MAAGAAVRIVLIDDHAVVRAGYRRFLEQESGYEVIAEAGSGEEAYQLLQRVSPDIVILDLSMPGEGGLSALRRYKLRWPLLPVLVFSMHDHLAFAIQALRAGANGYVTKSSDPQLMVGAVRRVLAGEVALSPDLAARMGRAGTAAPSQPLLGLSVREFDIFRLIASGKSHEEIAALLCLSVKTITNQHSLIRQKLSIGSDIELFQLAVECGAVEARARRS
jgi:two-component system, NarL family, invasion response regulator UvrY